MVNDNANERRCAGLYPWRVSSTFKIVSRHRTIAAATRAAARWQRELDDQTVVECNWCELPAEQCQCHHAS